MNQPSDISSFTFKAIGVVHSPFTELYSAPRQPLLDSSEQLATIELFPHSNYEQALDDMKGIERLWILWVFHKALRPSENPTSWKPKVNTPRDSTKRGVFATRTPHRPNPIGISVVELVSIDGRFLKIRGNDMISATPILDIKPYIPQYDSFPNSEIGWLQSIEQRPLPTIEWTSSAYDSALSVYSTTGLHIKEIIERLLTQSNEPRSFNRVEQHNDNEFTIAVKEWRADFTRIETPEGNVHIIIGNIYQG
jgi:tRNA (adenine37-N6)-methyltransferase